MSRLSAYKYIGTADPMEQKEAYHCAKYLKRKADRITVVGRYLIDTEALLTPFNLDCFHCERVHRETCCQNGQPYAVENWQIPLIERVAPELAEQYPELPLKKPECGIWEQGSVAGTLRLHHGSCLFLARINGRRCCSLHAYAESNQQDVYSLKPFSCQLYPLDLIQIGEQVLITAVNADTAPFSRWGNDYLETFYCASIERRRQAKHIEPHLFNLEEYRPAYQWGLSFVRSALGADAEAAVKEALAG
jgi:hypothetical protein